MQIRKHYIIQYKMNLLSVKNIGFGFLMTGGEKIDDYATVLRFNKGELKVGLSTENKDLNQVLENILKM